MARGHVLFPLAFWMVVATLAVPTTLVAQEVAVAVPLPSLKSVLNRPGVTGIALPLEDWLRRERDAGATDDT